MNDIDRKIREALRDEDAALFESVGSQAVHQEVFDVFRGRSRWLMLFSVFVTLLFVILAVYAALRFFAEPELRQMAVWGGVCFFALIGVTGMKVWFWLQMTKNATLREIKRVELQVALVAREIAGIKNRS